uniref:Uncharacterized protein n=1 Tax=Oryza brachyantha TaxID=4533 RepID=J3ME72_ORYBR
MKYGGSLPVTIPKNILIKMPRDQHSSTLEYILKTAGIVVSEKVIRQGVLQGYKRLYPHPVKLKVNEIYRAEIFLCVEVIRNAEIRKTYWQGHITPNIMECTQNEKFHEWFKAHLIYLERKHGDLTYYGRIIDITELNCFGQFLVVVHGKEEQTKGYDIGKEEWKGDTIFELFYVSHLGAMFNDANNYEQWARTDVEEMTVDAHSNALNN